MQTPALTVKPQVSRLNDLCLFIHGFLCLCASPAYDCLDARLYLQNVKGFGNIIVCAILESEYFVHVLAFCCEHDDRHIRKFPDLLADFQPCQFWQHDIQQNQIILITLCHLERLFSIIGALDLHIILFQTKTKSFYNQLLIIYYQNLFSHH